jgi:hypothetical protein
MDRYSYDRRVAQDVEEIARAMFFDGVPADGGEWHGEPPVEEIAVSFVGLEATDQPKFRGDRGEVTLEANIDRHADGIYVDSILVWRFLEAYPKASRILVDLFEEAIKRKKSTYERDIRKLLENPRQAWKIGSMIFGYHESDEWEEPSDVRVKKVTLGPMAEFDRRKIQMPWSAQIEFTSKKKTPIGEGPFTSMSDRELNKWIGEWESQAPENFWMDGELNISRSRAYKMYRERWRKMRPREQVRMMESLERYM